MFWRDFENVRLSLAFLPLVARVRWKLWRVPLAANSKTWLEEASRELDSARAGAVEPLAPFEAWRRAHAIRRAARLVPGASCLTQALALQNVLSKCGEPCALILGVGQSQKPGAKFEAHAWIEWQDHVLIGGPIERWKPLLTVQSRFGDERSAASGARETPREQTSGALNAPPSR